MVKYKLIYSAICRLVCIRDAVSTLELVGYIAVFEKLKKKFELKLVSTSNIPLI